MRKYQVTMRRKEPGAGHASCKAAEVVADTSIDGREDAFNPAELFLASIAACMLKGIERAVPLLGFALSEVEIRVDGVRQDSPPKMTSVAYEIIVVTDETDRRLDLLHRNLRKFSTIFNTVSGALQLEGTIRRRAPSRDATGG